MPLECTIICVDNSEWMRNGDYIPTRFEAQHDAANCVLGAKTQQNPENTVGVLTMAGKGVELLVSPTDDIGKLLSCLHNVRVGGKADVAGAVQVAQLALKHRRNKNGGQRVVVFVGSPIEADAKALVKVGKQLKKNGVAVDVISMGEIEENKDKLQEFVDATNSNNNSHLVSIAPGLLPSDVIITSPIIHGGDGDGGAGVGAGFGAGAGGDFGGVDPNVDPALAMALRVSFEEERARQEAAAKKAAEEGGGEATAMETDAGSTAPMATDMDEDEEALLKQALAMSMAEQPQEPQPMDQDEDKALQMALQMSLQESQGSAPAPAPASAPAPAPAPSSAAAPAPPQFADPDFVRNLLGSLEGVDVNDPNLLATLEQLGIQSHGESKEEKKGEEKGDKK